MEASSPSTRGVLPERDARPSTAARLGENLAAPVRSVLTEAGDLLTFSAGAVAALPGSVRYFAETLRQAGLLITGSALIIVFMQFVIGVECAIEANYVLRGYGASIYSGVFTSWCAIREMAPYMWGYIVAAKIGCGLVAEIGSMRINEEIDALESTGINPMSYLVATRLLAAWMVMPFIFIIGLAFHFLANYLVIVVQIAEVSRGGWELIHWSFQSPIDLLFAQAKIMAMGTVIVLVGIYHGYTAKGGPVGVGTATARSMILNLVLIHIIGSVGTMLFWGLTPNAPVGG